MCELQFSVAHRQSVQGSNAGTGRSVVISQGAEMDPVPLRHPAVINVKKGQERIHELRRNADMNYRIGAMTLGARLCNPPLVSVAALEDRFVGLSVHNGQGGFVCEPAGGHRDEQVRLVTPKSTTCDNLSQ